MSTRNWRITFYSRSRDESRYLNEVTTIVLAADKEISFENIYIMVKTLYASLIEKYYFHIEAE